jgi:prepilin-type processing-associated H-X9-DG protein
MPASFGFYPLYRTLGSGAWAVPSELGADWGWPTPGWARHYFTTGRILDPTQTGLLFESTCWEGAGFYSVCYWPGCNPENYPALEQECAGIRNPIGPFAFILTRSQWNAGTPWAGGVGGLAYRHGGEKFIANLAFLDGHVEQVTPKDLFDHAGRTPGYTLPYERGWVWNLELPGGKTPDWYDQYYWYTRHN